MALLSLQDVNIGFGRPLLIERANLQIERGEKVCLLGRNGTGKSTLLKLINGDLIPDSGEIVRQKGMHTAYLSQEIPKELHGTVFDIVSDGFEIPDRCKPARNADLEWKRHHRVEKVISQMQLDADAEFNTLSAGLKRRVLLARGLVCDPDILLLDEPTNNLDRDGIDHLTGFLMMYEKTVLVISHDADFLNAFTEGVLHLDVYRHKTDMYVGNYSNVVEEIAARVERDRMKNAQLLKQIQDRKDKVNFFAHKGGKMRKLAAKLKDEAEEAEENMVDVRRDDKTIRDFLIPSQDFVDTMVTLNEVRIIKNHEPHQVKTNIKLRRKHRLLVSGANGIGKSTLLRALAEGKTPGLEIDPGVSVGYYRQDFSGLDFDRTAYQALEEMMVEPYNQEIYAAAAQFLLNSEILKNKVGSLSEGQKGLLCYARFYLQKPGLLILDEPTNHINFRHLPVIAKALNEFQGAIILVSHAYEFVDQIQIDQTLDLGAL